MKQHFVTFFSPGTFVAEQSVKPIDSWDVETAVKMAGEVTERHGAKPYAFRFSTRGRSVDELDSKVIKTSPTYYLSGTVETLEDIERRNDPKESILLGNMRCNGWKRVVTTQAPYGWTLPLEDGDVVLKGSQ